MKLFYNINSLKVLYLHGINILFEVINFQNLSRVCFNKN